VLHAVQVSVALTAAALPACAPPAVRPRPDPADRDHRALAMSVVGGYSSAVQKDGQAGGYHDISGAGGTLTLRRRFAVAGATLDFASSGCRTCGSQLHAGLLLGIDGGLVGPVHGQLLGEVGGHHFSAVGREPDQDWPIFGPSRTYRGPRSDLLPYSGLRAGLTIDRWDGFFVGAWAIARRDLTRADHTIYVTHHHPWTGQDEHTVERYRLGGHEGALTLAAGAKF